MLKIREVRSLLQIGTRDTINSYLRLFKWEDEDTEIEEIDWTQFRRILELKAFLGLRPGCHSKDSFLNYSQEDLNKLFTEGGISIEQRLSFIQQQYQQRYQQERNKVSLTLALNND